MIAVFWTLALSTVTSSVNAEHDCYSCASKPYLDQWLEYMYHLYPPKNFTDDCNRPSANTVDVRRCNSACFTLKDYDEFHGNRFIRGCADKLALFDLQAELREELNSVGPIETCRAIDRELLLPSVKFEGQSNMVVLCACAADRCNQSPTSSDSSAAETLHDVLDDASGDGVDEGSGDGSGDGVDKLSPPLVVRNKREVPLTEIDDDSPNYTD
uniref:Uncharacterized protein n=1 Tax=Plectus sambesii TaxID=2011161 RepID=A0A914X844_9BILA